MFHRLVENNLTPKKRQVKPKRDRCSRLMKFRSNQIIVLAFYWILNNNREEKMAQLRKNPLTKKWIIYPNVIEADSVRLFDSLPNIPNHRLPDDSPSSCIYCPSNIPDNLIEILTYKDQTLYFGNHPEMTDWDIKVTAATNPVFRIEDKLMRRGEKIYDIMGSPGAHEIIIMTPEHQKHPCDFSALEIHHTLLILQQRMSDLMRDSRLGHLFAYHLCGSDFGVKCNHSVLNLVAAPFVPEKIQRELSGAYEWYRMKERCLFCDIIEEEIKKRDKGLDHVIIEDSTDFTAIVPYFAAYPLEIWILPVEHNSDFLTVTGEEMSDLSRILNLVLYRIKKSIGLRPLTLDLMTQPNLHWGHRRGYWQTLEFDWHWSLRIIAHLPLLNDDEKAFHAATGSQINPIIPESAAKFLRR